MVFLGHGITTLIQLSRTEMLKVMMLRQISRAYPDLVGANMMMSFISQLVTTGLMHFLLQLVVSILIVIDVLELR
jgi:hypothetical protein